jgi:predicted metal-dependent phosphoesterase TrpH
MPAVSEQSPMKLPKRIDLHCHSRASTEADEAMLQAIRCPESFSEPADIYDQATHRGMDFVTITDHDSIAGVKELTDRPNVLTGEEVTCYFPEDRCKIHLLAWGITPENHAAMQHIAHDIYALAAYVAQNQLAHAVAHPLYRQNGILDRWHIERLLLLFKGFECLNGAHSTTHREVFEPLLEQLDVAEIRRLERLHRIDAIGPKPWLKTRTAGSDDHGLFNIGRTWTEFPEDTQTTDQLLQYLREGQCRPGGEAGSSVKLAHNFFGVGMRYYTRQVAKPGDLSASLIKHVIGEAPPPGKIATAALACRLGAAAIPRKLGRLLRLRKPPRGTELLGDLLAASAMKRARSATALTTALKEGRAPLAEHDSMFDLVCRMDRDVTSAIFDTIASAVGGGRISEVIDSLSTVVAQQALLLPYYFALFHQNQERDLLDKLSRRGRGNDTPRVGMFTDSTDNVDSAGRLAERFGQFAELRGLPVTILAASSKPSPTKYWRNFVPLVDTKLPAFPGGLRIPPVLEVMEWSDRKQFDIILVNSAGPMGFCGWLASRMLRVPMVAISHEDLPAQMLEITGGDYRITAGLEKYIAWLYRSAAFVLTSGQATARVSDIRARPLPADDQVESVWDTCVKARRDQETQTVTTPMEAVRI